MRQIPQVFLLMMISTSLAQSSSTLIKADFILFERLVDIHVRDTAPLNMFVKKDNKRQIVLNSYRNQQTLDAESKEARLYKLGLHRYINRHSKFNDTVHYAQEHFSDHYKSLKGLQKRSVIKDYELKEGVGFRASLKVQTMHEVVNTHFDSYYFMDHKKKRLIKIKLKRYCDDLRDKKLSIVVHCNFIFHTKYKIKQESFDNITVSMGRYHKEALEKLVMEKGTVMIDALDQTFRELLPIVRENLELIDLKEVYELCLLDINKGDIKGFITGLDNRIETITPPTESSQHMSYVVLAVMIFTLWNILRQMYILHKDRVFESLRVRIKI